MFDIAGEIKKANEVVNICYDRLFNASEEDIELCEEDYYMAITYYKGLFPIYSVWNSVYNRIPINIPLEILE